jgi:predicted Rossmann-fold nucleotide-binding protein
MAKVLIAGALDFSRQDARDFARYLGEEVIEQGHVLMSGCLNELDKVVAQSAHDAATAKKLDPAQRIISYAVEGSAPVHTHGTLLRSRLRTWGLEFKRLQIPEPIRNADSVIIVGGGVGTLCAANWARIDNKPLLPITAFGGAGETTYHEEIKDFPTKYADRVGRLEYEALNQVPVDLQKVAREAVSLAAKIQASKHVVVIMSFTDDPKLQDLYESFKEICEEYQYECSRVDDSTAIGRIVPQILGRIRQSAFAIVDLTVESPNVYYELGLAEGLNKPCVVTAYKGIDLPFDVKDVPTIFWVNQTQLKEALRERIGAIASLEGRR